MAAMAQKMVTAPPGPLNPFESAFDLLRAIQTEIRELKDEVKELKSTGDARYNQLENDLDALRSFTSKHFDKVGAALEEERESRSIHYDQLAARTEEMHTSLRVRLNQLDAQLKAEMNIRFEQTQALDRKLRSEVSHLRTFSEKTSTDLDQHRQKVEADAKSDRQNHEDLRQDVEKLAALLSDSSLTRDPFSQLGYRPSTPTRPGTDLGTTSNGSNLPPLHGGSQRHASRPVTSRG